MNDQLDSKTVVSLLLALSSCVLIFSCIGCMLKRQKKTPKPRNQNWNQIPEAKRLPQHKISLVEIDSNDDRLWDLEKNDNIRPTDDKDDMVLKHGKNVPKLSVAERTTDRIDDGLYLVENEMNKNTKNISAAVVKLGESCEANTGVNKSQTVAKGEECIMRSGNLNMPWGKVVSEAYMSSSVTTKKKCRKKKEKNKMKSHDDGARKHHEHKKSKVVDEDS